MIIWVMGLLLIASFICFVIYAMKGGNLTIGFFILTIVWTLVYFLGVPFGIGKPFNVIEETFAQPALTYGSTIIQIICGAWFGRVLVDTGIAASIPTAPPRSARKARCWPPSARPWSPASSSPAPTASAPPSPSA